MSSKNYSKELLEDLAKESEVFNSNLELPDSLEEDDSIHLLNSLQKNITKFKSKSKYHYNRV